MSICSRVHHFQTPKMFVLRERMTQNPELSQREDHLGHVRAVETAAEMGMSVQNLFQPRTLLKIITLGIRFTNKN